MMWSHHIDNHPPHSSVFTTADLGGPQASIQAPTSGAPPHMNRDRSSYLQRNFYVNHRRGGISGSKTAPSRESEAGEMFESGEHEGSRPTITPDRRHIQTVRGRGINTNPKREPQEHGRPTFWISALDQICTMRNF